MDDVFEKQMDHANIMNYYSSLKLYIYFFVITPMPRQRVPFYIRLSYKSYFFYQSIMFFSHDKSANSIFKHSFSEQTQRNQQPSHPHRGREFHLQDGTSRVMILEQLKHPKFPEWIRLAYLQHIQSSFV